MGALLSPLDLGDCVCFGDVRHYTMLGTVGVRVFWSRGASEVCVQEVCHCQGKETRSRMGSRSRKRNRSRSRSRSRIRNRRKCSRRSMNRSRSRSKSRSKRKNKNNFFLVTFCQCQKIQIAEETVKMSGEICTGSDRRFHIYI